MNEGERVVDEDPTLKVLKSIDRRLALLTMREDRAVLQRLRAEVLRTAPRIQMFHAIDGNKTTPELAKGANVSERAAQQLVKDLADLGLVHTVSSGAGRGLIPVKDDGAIVDWYLKLESRDADKVDQ
jgi:hypothetical protein